MANDSSTPVAVASLHGKRLAPDGSKLVLVEWTVQGSSSGDPEWMAPLHIHNDDDEAWYVLEGRLRVRVGDEDHDVPAGGAVIGPRGIPHTFCNPAPEPARYIVVMSDRTSALLDALHTVDTSNLTNCVTSTPPTGASCSANPLVQANDPPASTA